MTRFRHYLTIPILLVLQVAARAEVPRVLYSRYFNADGEARYLPDRDYSEILAHLERSFEVRANRSEPTEDVLKEIDVLLISNPSANAVGDGPKPPGFSTPMIERLVDFVSNGGGIVIMGNQEAHNLELASTNQLLGRFGHRRLWKNTRISSP